MSDPTVIDEPNPTRTIPAQEGVLLDPGKARSILIGVVAVVLIIAAAVTTWVHLTTGRSVDKAREKTEQVTACTRIEEGTAALACVVQIDE